MKKIILIFSFIFLLTGCGLMPGAKEKGHSDEVIDALRGRDKPNSEEALDKKKLVITEEEKEKIGIDNNKTQTQKILYKPVKNIEQCKGDLSDFSPKDRDTCNDTNALREKDASYCGEILDTVRRNLCYLSIAKRVKDSEVCSRINDNELKSVCRIYLIEASPDASVEESIFLSTKDGKISRQIVDIQTMYSQEGELSKDILQQHFDIIIKKASEKKSAIDNDNFDLSEL